MHRYIEIACVEEIPKNGMKVFDVEGLEVLLINVNDKFYAVENRCPQMGYPLYFGSLDGTTLTCGFHYAKFDITTGKALDKVTSKLLRTFELVVNHSQILVKLR